MNRLFFNKSKGEHGQAFMEMAISLVFLLVLLSAVIDLGWAFYTVIAMRDAAQEAAAYGSLCPDQPAKIEQRLKQSASAPLDINDITDLSIAIIDPNTGSPAAIDYGRSVRVTLTVQHHIMTPFIGSFIGNNWEYPLTVTSSDTILRKKCP